MSDDTRRHTYYHAIPDNRCIFHRRLFALGIETIQYRNCPRSSASSKAEPAVYLHFPILPLPYTWIQFSFVLRWQQVTRYRFHLASLPGVFPSTIIDEISRNRSHCWRFPRVKEEKEGKREGETITRTDPPNDSYVPILQYSYNRCSIIFGNSDSSILLISSVLFRN